MAGKGGGGAWKVAYADFVTAMMALFLVLWILAQDTEILQATSRYFQNPFNSPLDRSAGVLEGDTNSAKDHESAIMTSIVEMGLLHEIAREFYRMLDIDENLEAQPVMIQVTDDGLRIVVYDLRRHPVFEPGTAEFTEWGRLLMKNLAWLVESYQLQVRIDTHCAQAAVPPSDPLQPFVLTQQRAHATQSALHFFAIPANRFRSVSAFGDRSPLEGTDPSSPENDRIELSLHLPTG
jgi:chemotaxis protein MotB